MSALVSEFITIIGLFWTFMQTYLVPATVADINIIHVAIWVPVMLGLLTGTIGTIKGMWSRRGKKG